MTNNVLLAIGSNLTSFQGSPAMTVNASIEALESKGVRIQTKSPLYRTPAFPVGTGPDFVNAAVAILTKLTAKEVLDLLHDVEAIFGRERQVRWGQRTLDLDLIAYEDSVLPDPEQHAEWMALTPEEQRIRTPDRLILPHPRVQDRAFVLVPLAEIAPDWCHPVLNKTVIQMRDALEPADLAGVTLLE